MEEARSDFKIFLMEFANNKISIIKASWVSNSTFWI